MDTVDSDDERSHSAASPKANRRVVDFDPQDDDWEDEDDTRLVAIVPAARFRSDNIDASRSVGPNARATLEKKRAVTGNRAKALAADIELWEAEREERANALAVKHGANVKEVRRRMLSSTAFKPRRRVSTYNAKISRIMMDLNGGRGLGERYTMPQVKRMVREDPSMLEGFTEEDVAEMVEETLANRAVKTRGTRANNLAASADARRTLERLMVEITALAERAGMIGFAMFSRGHIHDKTIPVTIQSWGALEFIREVLKRDPADVAALFELWAVSRERGETGAETLAAIQKECTAIIKSGLQTILGRTKVAMNYDNYIKSLVLGKNIGLVNWPHGVDFKRMSLQSAIGPLRILYDTLKCGTTRWKVLTAGEKKQLVDNHSAMVAAGAVREKERKPRAKRAASKRGERDEDSEEEEEEEEVEVQEQSKPRKKQATATRSSQSGPQGRRSEEEEHGGDEGQDEEEEDNEDNEPRKPIAQMSVEEKRARLLKLGARDGGKEKEGPRSKEKTKAGKRKRAGGGGEEGEKGRKKAKRDAGEASGAKRRAPHDEEGGGKRKKKRVEAPLPGPVKPRPKPTPAWKGAAASSSQIDSTSTSADSGAGTSAAKKNTVRGVKGKGPPGWRPHMDQGGAVE
ncbi:hypothetical protein B0H14DRAFT_3458243 [Mycena olivaceomarginata]|nr:hypothetical protein B0H14DRAFT_3458243 [Mycena olivaceomarginata]